VYVRTLTRAARALPWLRSEELKRTLSDLKAKVLQ
jgi:hypothetical protein